MNEGKRIYRMALNRVPFFSSRDKLILLHTISDPDIFFHKLTKRDLEHLLSKRIRSSLWMPEKYLKESVREYKVLTASNIKCIFYEDRNYPPQLSEIYDPPVVLYYRGELPDYNKPLVGIVGTRKPTNGARKGAFRLSLELACNGISVVSGLAFGIDKAAHDGCLKAEGKTVAVLGCGVDKPYPVANLSTARSILEKGGCMISEYPVGTPPLKYHFPERNRIISGLSRSLVVVEAPASSGALITADYALEQGRDLFVHEAGLNIVAGEGTIELKRAGAKAIQSAEDIFVDWGWTGCRTGFKKNRFPINSKPEGLELAELLEMELKGELVFFEGEYIETGDI
jgi:DNA processing protein